MHLGRCAILFGTGLAAWTAALDVRGDVEKPGDFIPAHVAVIPPLIGPYRYALGDEAETHAIAIAGTSFVLGRSRVVVHAGIGKVRDTILAFSHYPEFMPHYRHCRVLGRSPSGGHDVYMEVEALHGAMTMWVRLDVMNPRVTGENETIDTHFLGGNVRDLRAAWHLRSLSDKQTELTLDLFLSPMVPVPSSLLNSENMSGSAEGVLAMKARVEKR